MSNVCIFPFLLVVKYLDTNYGNVLDNLKEGLTEPIH